MRLVLLTLLAGSPALPSSPHHLTAQASSPTLSNEPMPLTSQESRVSIVLVPKTPGELNSGGSITASGERSSRNWLTWILSRTMTIASAG